MSLLKEKPFLTPNDKGIMGSDDAASIQNAIDTAAKAGVNKVVIPRYNKRADSMIWTIGATIQIPGNMHLVLDNCHLRLAEGFAGQMFTNALSCHEAGKLIAGEQTNIKVQGKGNALLDGGTQGETDDPWGSALLYFHNVREFSVEGFRVANQGGWGLCFMYCSFGKVAYIDFDSEGENREGVMLRCGCHDLCIEDITGYTGSNVLAINAVVGKQLEEPWHVMGHSIDVRNITVKNIKATTRGGGNIIRLFNQDGATMYNILIESVNDISVPQVEKQPTCAVRIGGQAEVNVRQALHGETKNITLRNLFTHAKYAVAISNTLANSLIENVHLHDDGACAVATFREEGVTTLSNLLFKGIYYNVDREDALEAGQVISLANCEGKNVVIRDVLCAKTARLAAVSGQISVDVMDVTVDELGDTLVDADEAATVKVKNIKVKGEVQK